MLDRTALESAFDSAFVSFEPVTSSSWRLFISDIANHVSVSRNVLSCYGTFSSVFQTDQVFRYSVPTQILWSFSLPGLIIVVVIFTVTFTAIIVVVVVVDVFCLCGK